MSYTNFAKKTTHSLYLYDFEVFYYHHVKTFNQFLKTVFCQKKPAEIQWQILCFNCTMVFHPCKLNKIFLLYVSHKKTILDNNNMSWKKIYQQKYWHAGRTNDASSSCITCKTYFKNSALVQGDFKR